MYVCLCYPLTEDGIKSLIKKEEITNFSQLVEKTSAGTGCGTCTSSLKKIFEEVRSKAPEPKIQSDKDFIHDLRLLSKLIVADRVAHTMSEDDSLRADIEKLEQSIIEYAQGNKVSLLMSPSEDIREATTYILRRMKAHG